MFIGAINSLLPLIQEGKLRVIATPGFHQRMAAIGVDVLGTTPAAYAKTIGDDYAKWGKVAAAAGIKPD